MRSKLRAGTPILMFAFIGVAVLFIASCTTDEVTFPDLTGPSGARLFITMDASPEKVFIRRPTQTPGKSDITVQLKNQQGQGVSGVRIAFRIINAEGAEVAIGSLDHLTVVTDAGGFARVTYTAPSTAEQPVPVRVYIGAIMTDPSYTFEVTGRHALDLELAKPFDCVGGPGAPEIAFSVNPTSPVVDQLTCFDAQATVDNGSIISFTWSFGDGGTSSGPFVCHTFTDDGNFPVTLTVVDGDQNCVSLTQFVTVGEGGSPSCSFTASPNPVNTDTVVIFDASASQDPDGEIVSYRWTFGDGSSGSGERTTHVFEAEGSFTVTLTVRDNSGNENVCTQAVTVSSGLPTCDFDFNPTTPNIGETVTFDATGSVDPDGGNLTFAWDFDDDGSFDDGSGSVVNTSFDSEGTFLVSLQVTDDEGNSVVCTQSITIGAGAPTCPTVDIDPDPAAVNEEVTFTITETDLDPDGGTVTFAWDLDNDGSFDDGTSTIVTFSYPTPGVKIVRLQVTDDEGVQVICTYSLNVGNTPPVCVSFTASSTDIEPGDSVDFNVDATDADAPPCVGCSVQFSTPGGNPGGSVDNTAPFQQLGTVYASEGTFTASATVTDAQGGTADCPDIEINVAEPPPVVPTITINDPSVIEGDLGTTNLVFTVSLSEPTTENVVVNYSTADGTATVLDADYIAVPASSITITPGNTSGQINIAVNGDVNLEPDETMAVNLTGASGGTVVDNQGIGTITNDD